MSRLDHILTVVAVVNMAVAVVACVVAVVIIFAYLFTQTI